MKAFWAIVRLTFRNAIRSHIFQLLLLLLLLLLSPSLLLLLMFPRRRLLK